MKHTRIQFYKHFRRMESYHLLPESLSSVQLAQRGIPFWGSLDKYEFNLAARKITGGRNLLLSSLIAQKFVTDLDSLFLIMPCGKITIVFIGIV